MKAVILAGGFGTRLAEETDTRPKPLVEVGGMPLLWHIMKLYSHHGINDFIICLGYKGYLIKQFFANYKYHSVDIQIKFGDNSIIALGSAPESWTVTLVDTGLQTMIGGRIKRILPLIGVDSAFCLTYGDGVADVNIGAVIAPARFGILQTDGNRVTSFDEKPTENGTWINGGFFVLSTEVGRYIAGDSTVWEKEPLGKLATDGQLTAYFHRGFWQPMDTLRDKRRLEELWSSGSAPWKVWAD
jgi:glucose-1-phosphate cytidylyltransferase